MSDKRYTSIDGFFGSKIYYDEFGNYAGESRESLIPGSYNHYNADGEYVGSSDQGVFADYVHRDANGRYAGESWSGLYGETHYDADGYVGQSWDTLTGTATSLDIDLFEPFE